jgi:outer membrane protein TolC
MRGVLLAFLILGCASVRARAEDPTVLTWPDAVKVAMQQNPVLTSALKSWAASQADLTENLNGLLPRLDLSAAYSRSQTNNDPESRNWNVGGTASVDVFNMSRYASIYGARAAVEQALASLQLAAANILFSLRSSFVSLLYAQAQENVSKTIKELRDNNARMVTLRYQSGRESKGNMLVANAQQLQANADLVQASRNIVASQQEFSHQLGWSEPKVMIATGAMTLDDVKQPPREVIAGLVESNPSVILAEARLKSAESAVKQAESDLWPRLTASYSRDNFGPTFFPENRGWTAGGSLDLPIFSNGPAGTFYAVTAARRLREATEADLRETRNQVRSGLESSWANLAGAIDNIHVEEAFLTAARQRNDEADIRYTSGLMSYEDWALIVSDRVNFERGVVSARRDGLLALAQWNKSAGQQLGNPQ